MNSNNMDWAWLESDRKERVNPIKRRRKSHHTVANGNKIHGEVNKAANHS